MSCPDCEHWRVKAGCYGDMVHGISPVLAAAGFPVEECAKDGNVGAIPRAVTQMRDALQARYDRLLAAEEGAVDILEDEAIPARVAIAMSVLRDAIREAEEVKE